VSLKSSNPCISTFLVLEDPLDDAELGTPRAREDSSLFVVPWVFHFKTSLDALRLRSDVISSLKILFFSRKPFQ
jgi:hypothetical protein